MKNIIKMIGVSVLVIAFLFSNTKTASAENFCFNFDRNLGVNVTLDVTEGIALQNILNMEGVWSLDEMISEYTSQVKSAVISLQNKYYDEILAPNDLDTGTGYFGYYTRMMMNRVYNCDSVSSTSASSIEANSNAALIVNSINNITADSKIPTVLPWTGVSSVAAGSRLSYSLNWNGPSSKDQSIFVFFVNSAGVTKFYNIFNPKIKSSKWSGNVSTPVSVIVPVNTIPGTYKVMVGMYKYGTLSGARLPLMKGVGITEVGTGKYANSYQVGTVTVVSRGSAVSNSSNNSNTNSNNSSNNPTLAATNNTVTINGQSLIVDIASSTVDNNGDADLPYGSAPTAPVNNSTAIYTSNVQKLPASYTVSVDYNKPIISAITEAGYDLKKVDDNIRFGMIGSASTGIKTVTIQKMTIKDFLPSRITNFPTSVSAPFVVEKVSLSEIYQTMKDKGYRPINLQEALAMKRQGGTLPVSWSPLGSVVELSNSTKIVETYKANCYTCMGSDSKMILNKEYGPFKFITLVLTETEIKLNRAALNDGTFSTDGVTEMKNFSNPDYNAFRINITKPVYVVKEDSSVAVTKKMNSVPTEQLKNGDEYYAVMTGEKYTVSVNYGENVPGSLAKDNVNVNASASGQKNVTIEFAEIRGVGGVEQMKAKQIVDKISGYRQATMKELYGLYKMFPKTNIGKIKALGSYNDSCGAFPSMYINTKDGKQFITDLRNLDIRGCGSPPTEWVDQNQQNGTMHSMSEFLAQAPSGCAKTNFFNTTEWKYALVKI